MEKISFEIVLIFLVAQFVSPAVSQNPLAIFHQLFASLSWGTQTLKINLSEQRLLDALLTTDEIISKYGYPVETHFVTTEDGYILRLHRIPRSGGKPILLQHGFLDSSATFINTGPEVAPAYYLWNNGYDVWLGNIRGNRYSRNHTSLDPNRSQFWDFSFHEMGIYDLPAMIDYILDVSNNPKLTYVGHSQGTTVFFVMCSKRPEYNKKVNVMHALAPIAFVNHMTSPILPLVALALNSPLSLYFHELFPSARTYQHFCFNGQEIELMCLQVMYMGMGRDYNHLNVNYLPILLGHVPAGTSVKGLRHFMQLMKSGKFREFDYGKDANIKKYGREEPLDYDISQINVPISLYYGDSDMLSVPFDVERLEKLLGVNVVGKFYIPGGWNHVDFVWATDTREIIYDKVLAINGNMERLNK